MPQLNEHLAHQAPPLAEVLPALWRLIVYPRHLTAFALTFTMMLSHMLVIPFISPVLVANHGVAPAQLSWIYMAGGTATFFTSRAVGRLADRYGRRQIFRVFGIVSMLPLLFVTHLPDVPFAVFIVFFAFFMVVMSGRMVPMQALLTTVPAPPQRGAFLSANSAVQALGTGCGAWLGGLMLSQGPAGQILGYGANGWLAVALLVAALLWAGQVKGSSEGQAAPAPDKREWVGEA
ncbi:MFS transporter [Trinickia violacea]|uniref:MFS transporter n=1 Tax=Trinickia violacea TaxID=2571746 RepID=A0A4P8IRU4_9BURK|nr:MFS transporter [Trinickia violacea]